MVNSNNDNPKFKDLAHTVSIESILEAERRKELEKAVRESVDEYQLFESIKKGFNFLRANIVKVDPDFFKLLENPEYGGTGWDLMWELMEDGFKYRSLPKDVKEAIEQ